MGPRHLNASGDLRHCCLDRFVGEFAAPKPPPGFVGFLQLLLLAAAAGRPAALFLPEPSEDGLVS